jgi:O-antigen ligase
MGRDIPTCTRSGGAWSRPFAEYHPDVTKSPSPTAPEPPAESPGLPAFLLALYVIFSATTGVFHQGGPRGVDDQLRWGISVSDVALAAVVLTQLPALRALWTDRSRHRCALGAVILAISLLPALALHPSARGVAAELRWVGVAMVAFGGGRLVGAGRDLVLGALAGATGLQVLVALAQRASDGPLGLGRLGEPPEPFEIGGRYASTGLTVHPYVLAAWCVLGAAVLLAALARADRPPAALKAAAIAAFVGVGLTMSRAGALAVVLVLACLAAASLRRPSLRVVLAGAVVASAFGVALDLSGWANRAAGTARAGSVASVTSNRTQLLRQAQGLLRDSPVVGVGPGRYVEALVRRPELDKLATQRPSRPVHVVPVLVLVEGGLLVLPALMLIGWAVATQTWRAGVVGLAVTLAVAPFMVLDHLNWSYPQGLLLTGLWLGVLDHLGGSAPSR